MPKRQNQSDHDQMVTHVYNYLMGNNYRDVRADLRGFPQPTEIQWKSTGKGHIPDVTAQNEKFNIFEVETTDSIMDSHTEDQWKLFAAHARNNDYVFWVVVPKGAAPSANQRLSELGIQAKVWEV